MQFTLRRGPTVQTEMLLTTARIHCTISQRLSGAMVLRQHQHNIGYTADGYFFKLDTLDSRYIAQTKTNDTNANVLFLNKYQRLTNVCASEVVTKIL